MILIFAFITVSAIHGAQPYQYANAQKLIALPAYHQQQTQAYKTIVAPTTSTAASSYTAAYVQPTAISPVKVRSICVRGVCDRILIFRAARAALHTK